VQRGVKLGGGTSEELTLRKAELEIRQQELERQKQRDEDRKIREKELEFKSLEIERQRKRDELDQKRKESLAEQSRFFGDVLKHSLPKMGHDPGEFSACHMLLLSPERRRQSLGSAGIHFR